MMKSRAFLLASSMLAVPAAAAAQPVRGIYVDLGAGADFLQNEIVKPSNAFGPSRRAYTFDPGAAGEIAVGIGIGRGLRLEVEGDYAFNHASGVRFPSGAPGRAIGHQQQYGGFVNALYDLDLGLPVTPYVGVGAGYQRLELDRIGSGLAGARVVSNLVSSRGAFAYQAIAGLGYGIAAVPGLSLTAEYRMIGVQTPSPFDRGGPSRAQWSNIFNHELLLGLRYAFGAAPAPQSSVVTAPPTAAPAPAAARSYLLFFDWDRWDLSARARQIVGEAARASTRVQTTRIEIDGYTDRSGTPAYNQDLSIRRARSVRAELLRDGVGGDQIALQGYGEGRPLVATADGVREPQNRRVEIILRSLAQPRGQDRAVRPASAAEGQARAASTAGDRHA